MEDSKISATEVRDLITSVFHGVTLGKGISLRQAQVMDRYGEGITDVELDRLAQHEVTDDWCRVTLEELERDCVAHLDAEGYRYYIPALMLSVISHYDPASMRVIGTLSSLYPKKNVWAHQMNQYALLTSQQLEVIARYVEALPGLVQLTREDSVVLSRGMRNYWDQFIR